MTDQMPASIESERAILGAILMDPKFYPQAAETLRPEDFFLASHRVIFLNMMALDRKHVGIDIVTLAQVMGQDAVKAIGGSAYLASLTEGLPRRPSIKAYVQAIKEKAHGREVIRICGHAMARVGDEDQDAVLSGTIRDLERVMLGSAAVEDMQTIGQFIDSTDPMEQKSPGIPTGFKRYDEMSLGLHRKELTIVAGRSSMGKTSWAGSLAMSMARKSRTIAVFLNEQTRRSFTLRMIAARSSISLYRLRANDISDMERIYARDAQAEIRMLPIFLEEDARSIMGIRTKSSRLIREGEELSAIVIDQLNQLSNDGVIEKGSKLRSDEVIGEKVLACKQIAKDLDVPVILLCQVNRGGIKNEDSRPTLENLKGSGFIEEHADNVVFLHRPGYYDKSNRDLQRVGEFVWAKQRDGMTGVCNVEFIAECCNWTDN